MKTLKEQLSSKKLVLALLLFIASVIFLLTEYALFSEWSDFVKWIFGLYAAGNVGEHVSTKMKP